MHKVGTALVVLTASGTLSLLASGVANAAPGTTLTVKAVTTSFKIIKDTPPKNQLNPGDKFQFTEKTAERQADRHRQDRHHGGVQDQGHC